MKAFADWLAGCLHYCFWRLGWGFLFAQINNSLKSLLSANSDLSLNVANTLSSSFQANNRLFVTRFQFCNIAGLLIVRVIKQFFKIRNSCCISLSNCVYSAVYLQTQMENNARRDQSTAFPIRWRQPFCLILFEPPPFALHTNAQYQTNLKRPNLRLIYPP